MKEVNESNLHSKVTEGISLIYVADPFGLFDDILRDSMYLLGTIFPEIKIYEIDFNNNHDFLKNFDVKDSQRFIVFKNGSHIATSDNEIMAYHKLKKWIISEIEKYEKGEGTQSN